MIQIVLSIFMVVLIAAHILPGATIQAGAPSVEMAAGDEIDEMPDTLPVFGVQLYGATGVNSTYYPFLAESGASWLRVPFTWESVEPSNVTPDQYRWGAVDGRVAAVLDTALGTDLRIILTVDHAPEWAASKSEGPIDKVDLSEVAELMGAVVERYDGDGIQDAPGSPVVSYFEFYNEPDRGCGTAFAWGQHGDQYAAMLKAVYPAMKAANPDVQVVFGGIAYDNFNTKNCDVPSQAENPGYAGPLSEWPMRGGSFVAEFLDDVLEACRNTQCFDIMNIHAYAEFAPNWTRFDDVNSLSVGVYEKIRHVRKKLSEYGMGNKPFIITEAGKPSNGYNLYGDISSTPEMQANHVVVFFTQAMAADVMTLIWWMLHDPTSYPLETGLVTVDGEKKPAFDAYKFMVQELGTARFERTLTPAETGVPLRPNEPPAMEAYKFFDASKGKSIYVAWLDPMWGWPSLFQSKPLTLTARHVVVRDIYGAVQGQIADADDGVVDGHVTVPITGNPVYIEVSESRIFLPRIAR